jgi:hypothetical protein
MAARVMRILITTKDPEVLRALLREGPLDMGCAGPRIDRDGTIRTDAYVTEDRIERLRRDGLTIEVLRDETAAIKAAQEQVGKGNRFEGENRVPRGLGRKTKGGGNVPQR